MADSAVQYTGAGTGHHPLVVDAAGALLEWAAGEIKILEHGIAERVTASGDFAGVPFPLPRGASPELAPQTTTPTPALEPADTTIPAPADDVAPAPSVDPPPAVVEAAPAAEETT